MPLNPLLIMFNQVCPWPLQSWQLLYLDLKFKKLNSLGTFRSSVPKWEHQASLCYFGAKEGNRNSRFLLQCLAEFYKTEGGHLSLNFSHLQSFVSFPPSGSSLLPPERTWCEIICTKQNQGWNRQLQGTRLYCCQVNGRSLITVRQVCTTLKHFHTCLIC